MAGHWARPGAFAWMSVVSVTSLGARIEFAALCPSGVTADLMHRYLHRKAGSFKEALADYSAALSQVKEVDKLCWNMDFFCSEAAAEHAVLLHKCCTADAAQMPRCHRACCCQRTWGAVWQMLPTPQQDGFQDFASCTAADGAGCFVGALLCTPVSQCSVLRCQAGPARGGCA